MSPQQRYMRTERRRPVDEGGRRDPESERAGEERARYGGFATWMVLLLLIATSAAVVGTIVFWPD